MAAEVIITNPAAGAVVSGTISVEATFRGRPHAAFNLATLTLDSPSGAQQGLADIELPVSFSLDTTTIPDGAHTLYVNVRFTWKGALLWVRSSVRVTVRNAAVVASLDPSLLPGGNVGIAYSTQLAVLDGAGPLPYTFAVSAGSLPAGLSLSSSGALTGTPTTAASYTFTVQAKDADLNVDASRSYTVQIVAAPPPSTGFLLPFTPPGYAGGDPRNSANFPGYQVVHYSNSNLHRSDLPDADCFIVIDEALTLLGGPWLQGKPGRNYVVIGGEVRQANLAGSGSTYDHSGLPIRGGGTVYLEGVLLNGATLHDGIPLACPGTDVILQNMRVYSAHAIQDGHPDCVQTQGGCGSLTLRYFTGYTELQGLFLKIESALAVGAVDIDYANIVGAASALLPPQPGDVPTDTNKYNQSGTNGGKYLFWQETADVGPITLGSHVYINNHNPAWTDFGMWVWPNKNAESQSDPTRKAIVAGDGLSLSFQNSGITGSIKKGDPPGGDYCPSGVDGLAYVSPGYAP